MWLRHKNIANFKLAGTKIPSQFRGRLQYPTVTEAVITAGMFRQIS